jgi:putative membrane-bound dehydrogenase-like protein
MIQPTCFLMLRPFLFLLTVVVSANSLLADPPKPESIFDGRSLAGWDGDPKLWRVEDGAITAEIPASTPLKDNAFIFWKDDVHDFDLTLEYRITGAPSGNSGIQYRAQRNPQGHAEGYQADLDDGAVWLGRIYDEHGRELLVERGTRVSIAPHGRKWVDEFAKPESFRALVKPGEWNTYRITAKASHVELWINGTLFAALDDHQSDAAEFSGKLALQLHSGAGPVKVQFRNIRLAHLGRTALPPPMAAATELRKPVQSIAPVDADGKLLNLGLETGSLANWQAEGDAWTHQPQRYYEPATPRRKTDAPTDPIGNYWIGPSSKTGDFGVGRLVSPTFPVTHRWASYLIGGGADINQTRIEIVDAASSAIIHSSSGRNSELLRREVIDFGSALGRKIFIRLIDNTTEGPVGYIAFDDFIFHDAQPSFAVEDADHQRQRTSPVLWHLQPNPAAPSPVPNVDAQKVVRDMMLVKGFQADLVAAEPDVHQPIALAIDEKGRLWIAEAYSYPNKQPIGEGKDRIIILEDQNGDGTFETRKVFIERLNLVSGFELGFGGVWVGAAPELLFIPDRNRDDRPDGAPEILLDGWGYQDTHETLNSFTWGPDGWLYGVHGVFTESLVGKPGTPDGQRVPLRAGVWRYHPTRHVFEVFASGGSNQWGVDYNEAGHLFMTHCRSFHGGGGTTHIIRNGHYWNQANADYAPFVSNKGPAFAPGLKNYLPSSARYDSGEGGAGKPGSTAVYGGHSHVGTMFYLGDNWPDIYRNHLFTHNLHGHQVNQQHNVRHGSGYETFHAGFDLMFTPDLTFVAVDLQYGPDGSVYMIDWCDHQHCHSPRDDVWERTNGRVYRVSWAATWQPAKVDLVAKSDLELAALHTHRNEWFVRTARRLLQERAAARPLDAAALDRLRQQANESSELSEMLRAVFTLHVVGDLKGDALARLSQHSSDIVRAWAVQFGTEIPFAPLLSTDTLLQLATHDSSPTVRLAIASALPALEAEARWKLIPALAAHGEDAADRFLPKMIWFGLAPLVSGNEARALEIADRTALPTLADSARWFAAQTPAGRNELVARLAKAPDEVAARGVRTLAFALESETGLEMPAQWPALAHRLSAPAPEAPEAAAAEQLSALFGDQAVLARNRERLADANAPLAERRAALALLKRANDTSVVPLYIRLLDDPAFRSAAIPLLAGTDNPAAASALIRHFPSLSPDEAAAALATLTSHAVLGRALLDAVESHALDKKNLTALHVRQLRNLGDAQIDERLDQVWGRTADSPAELKKQIADINQLYEEAPRWAYSVANGRKVYETLCVSCHKFDNKGGNLGPDLTGSWRNGTPYFIENIVDPNAVIGADFQLNLITKRDGSVVSGMVERESDTALIVRTVTETITVPKNQISDRKILEQSLMPPGLLDTISDREVVELLMFLSEKR